MVAVPAGSAEETLQAAIEREEREAGVIERLQNGELTLDILGFRQALPDQGVQARGSDRVG